MTHDLVHGRAMSDERLAHLQEVAEVTADRVSIVLFRRTVSECLDEIHRQREVISSLAGELHEVQLRTKALSAAGNLVTSALARLQGHLDIASPATDQGFADAALAVWFGVTGEAEEHANSVTD